MTEQDTQRFNLRLYEKDGIQFRAAQVTVQTTAREICEAAKEKWFRGWSVDICLGEQRGIGPVRPVDPQERPGEILARYRGLDELKYYLVVKPHLGKTTGDKDLSPRSGRYEQKESPDAYAGLARRMSVLRATSFSQGVGTRPAATTPLVHQSQVLSPMSATPQPTPLPSTPQPIPPLQNTSPSRALGSRAGSTTSNIVAPAPPSSSLSQDPHAVYGVLVVAPTPAPVAPAPMLKRPDQRKDTAAGLADITARIEAIRRRNEEEKRKIDARVAEEEEEKRRAEELTRKFEAEIEAMKRGDAERRAAAAQGISSFQKAARPPSERPTQDSIIGRRAPGDLRPLSADSGSVNRTSPLGSISRPPPPRPVNTVNTPLPPVNAPVRNAGPRIAVRVVSPAPLTQSSPANPSSTSVVGTPPAGSVQPLTPLSLRAAGSPRRRSGSAPAMDISSTSGSNISNELAPPKGPLSIVRPPLSPRSTASSANAPAATTTTTSATRPESPRSPRSGSLLSGQHRLTNSRDNSPAVDRVAPLSPREHEEIVASDLTHEESELLALEEEYEEMRVSQLPPATEAEQQAFVSTKIEDLVFIGTLAEGRLAPVRHAVYNGQEVIVKRIATPVPSSVLAERFGWLRNLRHVNIAPSLGICLLSTPTEDCSAGVYVISEYQAGGTLRLLLSSTALTLPWKLLLAMAVDVAKAMLYLHTKNVIHGALRSASVLVDLNGRLRLSDAGLARRFSDAPRADDTRYAAPEALTNGSFTAKGDVFSYGVLLWEIIHRKEAPFRRADDGYSAEAILEWPMPSGAMPELPLLLTQCLQQDPSLRPTFEDIFPRVRAMAVTAK